MALGLIKTSERASVVCNSDPAISGDTDEWTEVDNSKAHKDATVIVVRALNDREVMRHSASFREINFEEAGDSASTLQLADAMAAIVRAAFVECREGDETSTDADAVIHAMRIGPLISLGSWVLAASGMTGDPT